MLTERERALGTPRDSKEPGSLAWCWQTLYLLKVRWERKSWTDKEWDALVEEVRAQRVWEKVPPEQPYGSEDALFQAEIGVTEAQGRREIMSYKEAGKRGGRGHKANDNIMSFKQGTDPAYLVARLKRDRPDLHSRVLAGELSPHAAAIEAGFRRRALAIPCDVNGAVRALARHFDCDVLIAALLKVKANQTGARDGCS